jgi:hypothetical protein
MTLTFVVPMPANLANTGRIRSRNPVTMARAKKAYLAQLDRLQGAGLVPPPPPVAFRAATITSHMTLGGAMDDDNAMVRHKWPLDWLKTRGYIADDRRTCLTWTGFPSQTVTRKAPPTLTLTLTEIDR